MAEKERSARLVRNGRRLPGAPRSGRRLKAKRGNKGISSMALGIFLSNSRFVADHEHPWIVFEQIASVRVQALLSNHVPRPRGIRQSLGLAYD